jgi:hypothetical protein
MCKISIPIQRALFPVPRLRKDHKEAKKIEAKWGRADVYLVRKRRGHNIRFISILLYTCITCYILLSFSLLFLALYKICMCIG